MLPSFYRDFNPKSGEEAKNCTDAVIEILKEFKQAKVDGVIFDLRNNGGGSLEDARRIAGLFFKSGPVVQVKNSQGEIGVLSTDEKEALYDGPLLILQNSLSASASEILSAALKDRNRAVLVGGEHTHGKGTVQTLIPLDNSGSNLLLSTLFDLGSNTPNPLGALKLTVQMFYRINGASTQKRGVNADIVLPDVLDAVDTGEKHLDYVM